MTLDKYWISNKTGLTGKYQYPHVLSLLCEPENEAEIEKWCKSSFGRDGFYYHKSQSTFFYAEYCFKTEEDLTAFILCWGDSFISVNPV